MAPVLNPEDFVQVTLRKNASGALAMGPDGYKIPAVKDTDPLVIGWNSRYTTLYVDQPAVVQLEAAINAFGDPRSTDVAQNVWLGEPGASERLFIPDREAEVRRLRARYAVETGNAGEFKDWNGDSLIPQVEMKTLQGEDIVCVLNDPAGQTVIHSVQTVNQQQDQMAVIAHLQAQVDALTALVQGANNPNNPTSLSSLPSDSDTGQATVTQTLPPIDDPNSQPSDVVSELPPNE